MAGKASLIKAFDANQGPGSQRLRFSRDMPTLPPNSPATAGLELMPENAPDRINDGTFNDVADIIAETCNIDRATIRPESHTINDLGIDSLDFLDVTFAIDKRFGIKMPIEKWMQEINE